MGWHKRFDIQDDDAPPLVFAVLDAETLPHFASFSCGNEEWQADLREFLLEDALPQSHGRFSVTFVFYTQDRKPIGYVALSASQVERKHTQIGRRAPYPMVPAVLIGRLGVDASMQGQRYGERILAQVREWTKALGVGCRVLALQVDTRNQGAIRFYERERFTKAPIEIHRNMQWMFYDLEPRA